MQSTILTIETRDIMPHTSLARSCRTCPVATLTLLGPISGTVYAGDPTIVFPSDEPPPDPRDLAEFEGYYLPVSRPTLTAYGIAAGDTLMISTRTIDLFPSAQYEGRIVVATDDRGACYLGRYRDGEISDDRGTLSSDGLEVVGVVDHIIRRIG